ncbi:MAG: aryl-sulfate sulfotransferase [Deltaproteobacteria bacterium]|nr:aryl-sulfate sulfotransferase [Deltaproteobacteria bacterium]
MWLAGCAPDPPAPTADWSTWGATGISVPCEGPCTLTCSGGGEQWEETGSDFEWTGLLPGFAYACTLDGPGGVAAFPVQLDPPPSTLAAPVITGTTSDLTLFNQVRDGDFPRAILVDGAGRVRWWMDLPDDPNVGIEVAFLPDSPFGRVVLAGGGDTVPPTMFTLDGAVAWSAPLLGVAGGIWHHDAAWLPDVGLVVGLSEQDNHRPDGEGTWTGFAVETHDPTLDQRTWSWTSQQGVDNGGLPAAANGADAYHANSVQWVPDDPEGEAWWLSLKRLNQVVRLDPAGAVTWALGVGGDFALLRADGTPADASEWFYGQHAPEAQPTADPNIWSVYVHDNGMDRPNGALFSRAMRLDVDRAASTATIGWEWTEEGWYEPVFGDVDLLASGDVLVTMGHCPQCPGAPPERGSAIVEVDVPTGDVLWRADFTPEESMYRAQRIDPCAWYPQNRTACPG